ALQHPDVILQVHSHPAHLAHDPVIRQFFWPRGIDLVGRRRLGARRAVNTERKQTCADRKQDRPCPTIESQHEKPSTSEIWISFFSFEPDRQYTPGCPMKERPCPVSSLNWRRAQVVARSCC